MVIQQQIIAAAHQEKLRQLSVQASASIMPARSEKFSHTASQQQQQQPVAANTASSKMVKTLTTVRTPKKRRYNKQAKTALNNISCAAQQPHQTQQHQQNEDAGNCKRTRFVMNVVDSMRRICRQDEQPFIRASEQNVQESRCLSNFISQAPDHNLQRNNLPEHYVGKSPVDLLTHNLANNLSVLEPFATPPPSQPPASLLLSPGADAPANASVEFRRSHGMMNTMAGISTPQQYHPQHFTYPSANPLNSSSLLLTPPEVRNNVVKNENMAVKEHFVDVDEMKQQLTRAFQQPQQQQHQNQAIASFISAVTKQHQQQQQTPSNVSNDSAAVCNGTPLNANCQTGTTLALNQLIGNSSLFSSIAPQQQHQQSQHREQTQQQQQLAHPNRSENPITSLQERLLANNDGLPALLALLQQQQQQQQQHQQQQEIDVTAQQAMIVQLTIQKELQMLYQRQQIEQLIKNAAAQLQQQQQQHQTIAPELAQAVSQLLLQKNGFSLGTDGLLFVDQELKQQIFGSNFLSPPLTHTPLSLADDLSSASPSTFSLLSANASRSSPSVHYQQSCTKPVHAMESGIDRVTAPSSSASLLHQHSDRYHLSSSSGEVVGSAMEHSDLDVAVTAGDDLDAFERAIARQHGGLTDRESVAVAVLAAGLTDLRN